MPSMAEKQWAKVWRDAGMSRRLSELMKRDPVAYGLYWSLKAWADDFGRYPNDPDKFLMEAVPRMLMDGSIRSEDGARSFALYVELALCRVYVVDGEEYLELLDFHKHEDPNWNCITRPEYPAPPDWVPCPELVDFILANSHKPNITPTRYGITPENCPDCLRSWVHIRYSGDGKQQSTNQAELSTDKAEPSTNKAELGPTQTPTDRQTVSQQTDCRQSVPPTPHRGGKGARRAPSGSARRAKATPHGHDPTHDDLWRNKHGPPPTNKQQREAYYSALTCYERGFTGNYFGYDMPAQPPGTA